MSFGWVVFTGFDGMAQAWMVFLVRILFYIWSIRYQLHCNQIWDEFRGIPVSKDIVFPLHREGALRGDDDWKAELFGLPF